MIWRLTGTRNPSKFTCVSLTSSQTSDYSQQIRDINIHLSAPAFYDIYFYDIYFYDTTICIFMV